ncbi:hypothetical protein HJG53_09725 [Sphingomonas sp. ID1715]|uniref:hypothetical protein n=1 Tax=Sphingomonas sp. ID1715 TaxID=1656898 RepID=UPI001488A7B8|nr:hypothetical protein [Sphingomonas sp. ID1715]NNM77180.1 hypothetical protein [Sphingomonas sp. ID1715]
MILIAALLAGAVIPQTEQAAIYKAAGAARVGGKWVLCADQPRAEGLSVDHYGDLNGDGRPEAILSEGGTFCYGQSEAGFAFLSKQADGSWRKLASGPGIVEPLKTKGVAGYPDLSIGGPGFCFPVQRWNGRAYVNQRFEYEGKPCRPAR